MKIENGLRFDNRHLLRVSVEGMYVQFAVPGFEIYVAERLEPAGQHMREVDKYASIAGKFFQVEVALAIQIGAHFLDLKIGYITEPATQSAFM